MTAKMALQVFCDAPSCDTAPLSFPSWLGSHSVVAQAKRRGWAVTHNGRKHYCPHHAAPAQPVMPELVGYVPVEPPAD